MGVATYIIVALLAVLWAFCDAAQDAITFKYDNSVFAKSKHRQYFDPAISWKNKYKDGDSSKGARFFGSTTFLVWLTDFWHLLKFIKMNAMWGAISVAGGVWWLYFAGVIFHGIVFECAWRALTATRHYK